MEFKKLELKQEKSWIKRTVQNKQFQRTAIFTLIGAIAGTAYTYYSQGKQSDIIQAAEIIKNALLGAGAGIFITNSPCARGKC